MNSNEKYYINKSIYHIQKDNTILAVSCLSNVATAAEPKIWYSGDNKPKHAKIKTADRTKLNKALGKAGMDGNGRFASVGFAHNKLFDVLSEFGMEIDDVLSAWDYKEDSGHRTINYAFQTDDPYWPVTIDNSKLVFSWQKMPQNKFEILVYAS